MSRQHEAACFNYYGIPYYWAGGRLWGGYATPMMPPAISWASRSDGERAITRAQEALQRDEEPTGHPLERGVRPR